MTHWIQELDVKEGSLTAQAKRHNMTPMDFAHFVLEHEDQFKPITIKRANLALNLQKRRSGGSCYDECDELRGGIIHFDDHLSGGLKGVSRASGFIQRSMAEMKKKEGKYTKGNIELPALNLKDGAKFDAKKITKQSPFLYNHITKGVPYENNRLNPILTTGQTAGVRIIDGKEQSFKQPDPKYNKHTLRFYPLPRAGLRKLTAKEEAQKKKAIEEYTELIKNAYPADFVKNPNATPKSSANVSQKKGKKNGRVSAPVIQQNTFDKPFEISFKWGNEGNEG